MKKMLLLAMIVIAGTALAAQTIGEKDVKQAEKTECCCDAKIVSATKGVRTANHALSIKTA